MENVSLVRLFVLSVIEKKCHHDSVKKNTDKVMTDIYNTYGSKAIHYFESCLRLMTVAEFNILTTTGKVHYNIYVIDELIDKLESFITDVNSRIEKIISLDEDIISELSENKKVI